MCLLYFFQLTKSIKSCCMLYKNSPFYVTPVADRVTRRKQPIAYFSPVERKQIQRVRIELKSPIEFRFLRSHMRKWRWADVTASGAEWPPASVCKVHAFPWAHVYSMSRRVFTHGEQAQGWIFTIRLLVHWSQRASSVADLQQSQWGQHASAPEPWHRYRGERGGRRLVRSKISGSAIFETPEFGNVKKTVNIEGCWV